MHNRLRDTLLKANKMPKKMAIWSGRCIIVYIVSKIAVTLCPSVLVRRSEHEKKTKIVWKWAWQHRIIFDIYAVVLVALINDVKRVRKFRKICTPYSRLFFALLHKYNDITKKVVGCSCKPIIERRRQSVTRALASLFLCITV